MKRVVWLLLIVLIACAGCADKKTSKIIGITGTGGWKEPDGKPWPSPGVHEYEILQLKYEISQLKCEINRLEDKVKQSEDEQIHLRDINKLLAELDKRYVDQLAEFDKRYAERQQQWELRCQLQWQTTWWLWQVPWQWPLELQWQPLWYRCQWCVPVPEFTDIQKVESKPGPESPSKPEENEESDLEIPDLEIARQLAQSHFQEGKEAYDKGYFKQAISCFEKALKYEKFLTDTMRGEINKYKKMAQDNMKN